jgi:hypothetical protein
MKRFLSERNIASLLFVFTFTCFVFAQQHVKNIERVYLQPGNDIFSIPATKKAAALNSVSHQQKDTEPVPAVPR